MYWIEPTNSPENVSSNTQHITTVAKIEKASITREGEIMKSQNLFTSSMYLSLASFPKKKQMRKFV